MCPTECSRDEDRLEYLDKISLYFLTETSKSISECIANCSGHSLGWIAASNPAGARKSLFCECYVLCRGLCVGLIALPETCYREWGV